MMNTAQPAFLLQLPSLSTRLVILLITLLLSGVEVVHTGPSIFPTGLTINEPSKTYQGITIRSPAERGETLVLDMDGNVLHSWQSPIPDMSIAGLSKPLSNGHVLTFLKASLESPNPGAKILVEMDWDGKIVWRFDPWPDHVLHHDFQRLHNGNTLILSRILQAVPAIAPGEIWDDVISEVDPGGRIVWRWSTVEHYEELPLSADSKRLIYAVKNSDVFHTNSIQALPTNRLEASDVRFSPGNILVSQRHTSIVFIIEKRTGKIVWTFHGSIGQHHVSMIPDELPGAGNILLFDNGWRGGYPPKYRYWSRVIEINPVGQVIVWAYSGHKNKRTLRSFFSPYLSGAQRFPNGNTLISEGEWGRSFEVAQDGEIVWEYITGLGMKIYRTYRVDNDWPTKAIGSFPW
jgi:hypothetical protein